MIRLVDKRMTKDNKGAGVRDYHNNNRLSHEVGEQRNRLLFNDSACAWYSFIFLQEVDK